MKIDNKRKALVHVAKAKTGRTEDEYQAMLAAVGVSSSKDLTIPQFDAIMDQFKDLGFKTNFKRRRKSVSRDKKALMSKLDAILADMKLPMTYADGIARRRFDVDVVQWCDAGQLYKVVQMMAVYQKRHGGARKAAAKGGKN